MKKMFLLALVLMSSAFAQQKMTAKLNSRILSGTKILGVVYKGRTYTVLDEQTVERTTFVKVKNRAGVTGWVVKSDMELVQPKKPEPVKTTEEVGKNECNPNKFRNHTIKTVYTVYSSGPGYDDEDWDYVYHRTYVDCVWDKKTLRYVIQRREKNDAIPAGFSMGYHHTDKETTIQYR